MIWLFGWLFELEKERACDYVCLWCIRTKNAGKRNSKKISHFHKKNTLLQLHRQKLILTRCIVEISMFIQNLNPFHWFLDRIKSKRPRFLTFFWPFLQFLYTTKKFVDTFLDLNEFKLIVLDNWMNFNDIPEIENWKNGIVMLLTFLSHFSVISLKTFMKTVESKNEYFLIIEVENQRLVLHPRFKYKNIRVVCDTTSKTTSEIRLHWKP